jgi:xanthine/uracil permease
MAFGWKLAGDGKHLAEGSVVRPNERLSYGRMVGLGAQHVMAMFGATFVFPLIMGLNPNLAVMMSGVATILFLLIVGNRVPSYLGTSASFVGGVAAIRAGGGDSAAVTGAILIAGLLLALVGVVVHFIGGAVVNKILPPAVTGAVVMLIGFNLAPVAAKIYWPQDQWVAFITMVGTLVMAVVLRGFLSRITIFLGLLFGLVVSWLFDVMKINGYDRIAPGGKMIPGGMHRVDMSGVSKAAWFGLPTTHSPTFHAAFIILIIPAVIALIAENTGHVKAGWRPWSCPNRRWSRNHARLCRRWLTNDHLCREHRCHGRNSRLFDAGILHSGNIRDYLRALSKVWRCHYRSARWSARWNHSDSLRHDRSVGCKDLD